MTYVLILCPAGLDPASHPVKIVGTQRVALERVWDCGSSPQGHERIICTLTQEKEQCSNYPSLKNVEWIQTISLRLVECPRSSFVKCYMKVYQNDVCTHSVSCRTWSGIASCQNSRDATCCVRESMRLRVKPARTRTYYMHPHARKRTMFKLSFPEKRWMDSNDKPKVGWMLLYNKCYLVACYLL